MRPFHDRVETRWQAYWEKSRSFRTPDRPDGPRFYCLEMLPYPSGRIHMGHVRNYSIGDAVARFLRRRGYAVMHPIGWDALGLPAENAALENGRHPADWTRENIEHMRRQLRRLGFSYDWEREFATCEPGYYRWNQWFFLKMWERGLAYRRNGVVNWCPKCETVLANEQVIADRCWRCDAEVELRELPQWFLKITDYADELLDAMPEMDGWPAKVLTLQDHWIGRSRGAEIRFDVPALEPALGDGHRIAVFTTRVDTIHGATALVLAPRHPAAVEIARRNPEVAAYAKEAARKRPADHAEGGDKTGVNTGLVAVNPFTGEDVPVFVADYVLMEYGSGAVMAVPAHDDRDHAFAVKHGIEIRVVVLPDPDDSAVDGADDSPDETGAEDDGVSAAAGGAFTGYGTVVDSGRFSGLPSEEAKKAMTAHAAENGFGGPKTTYRFRDWGVSRQRYWGTPIPMIHCESCGVVPVPEEDLPVRLPRDVELTGKGGSALARSREYLAVSCPKCGADARRETDTMDTFVDSSWYFYRYLDPANDKAPFASDKAKQWFPIDLYIGGVEHAILHLIYCRFWTKVMRDLGLIEVNEPVVRQLSQGMVIKDGAKMSKSKGNVVDPDAVVEKHGADAIRLYVLFESPPEKEVEWTDARLEGPARFLRRLERQIPGAADWLADARAPGNGGDSEDLDEADEADRALRRKTHQTIRRVTRDLGERIHPNTAIAAIMELMNATQARLSESSSSVGEGARSAIREAVEAVVSLLNPMAPHLTEELWERLGGERPLVETPWPEWDEELAREEEVVIALQVNGRLRGRLRVPAGLDGDELRERAEANPGIRRHTEGSEIRRVVAVPDRLVNFVVR